MLFDLDRLRALGAHPCLLDAQGLLFTYAQLAEQAAGFAATLAHYDVPALIAIEAASEPEAIAAYVGTLAAGHAVMPLPADNDVLAKTLAQRFRPALSYRRADNGWQRQTHDWTPAKLHPELALLLQTSGSTGRGRGVRLSRGALEANARSIAEYLQIKPEDRAALVLPLHYSYGLSVLHSHLLQGASLWLHPDSVLADGFATALAESGATNLAGVPHHFNLLESAGFDRALPASLRLLTVAGGAMPPAKVTHWAERMDAQGGQFVVMYGQTEATARIAWLPPALARLKPDAIGIAIPGGTLALRDEKGRDIDTPSGEGELIYRGPNVMMGYAEGYEALNKGFEVNELVTGDLAQRDTEGIYRITGRRSRMSKIAGLRIGHDALERALADIAPDVAVWGDDRRIGIALTGPVPDPGAIQQRAAALSGVGAGHFEIHPLSALPRRANGKIDYPALKRLHNTAPAGRSLLEAFRATFATRRVRPSDSFASLGGDSLSHVELSLALEERLGGVPDGWEKMAIADLEQARPAAGHRLPTELVTRVLAILAVVVAHQTHWPVYGGAAAMVMLMGMSVSSFRWNSLIQGDMRTYFAPMLGVLVPYYLILAGYSLAWGEVPWVSALLLGNFGLTTPQTHEMLPFLYWFVEAYVQISLLIALPFLIPPIRRRLASIHPFHFGLGLFALALLLRVTIPEIWPMKGRAQFTLPWVLYLFALGWCVSTAENTRARVLVIALGCFIMPLAAYMGGNWYGGWIKYMSLLGVLVLLTLVPSIAVPRWSVRPLMRMAQAAFAIYLLHRLVPVVLMPMFGLEGHSPLIDTLAILGGIALGLLAADLQRRLMTRRTSLTPASPTALARAPG
ncbi:Long-chain-fatty-acid--CoA ligase [Marinobacterium lacunae]|uniref:Long-chain-fatty-acid--CoA ligase n=1 Tax=Marinobacterium lacunae TaxID=1232683 RepID=A0A081G2J9_9GAMM|nr:AMP-binding protein [Marinobacterium lacunae]KEA65004.1 Long-chain-fatty-acid--CoA ligase [Marinobacterium lacunae]